MHTIVDPTGVDTRTEKIMPATAQRTEITAEHKITDLKSLNTLMEDNAGKITSADISKEPTKFIARTIIDAVIIAIKRLYLFVLRPIAL